MYNITDYVVMLNPQTGKLVKIAYNKENSEKEIEKLKQEGFEEVRLELWYENTKYKVVYCEFHKRYECYYDSFRRIDKFTSDAILDFAEIIRNCRFFKRYHKLDDSISIDIHEHLSLSYFDIDNERYKKYIEIVKILNEVNRVALYLFIHKLYFRKEIIKHFEENKTLDKDYVEKLTDDYLKSMIEDDNNPLAIISLTKFSIALKQMFLDNELVKKHLERAKKIILENVETFIKFKHLTDEEKKEDIKLIYEFTNDSRVLKYLL